MLLDRWLRNIFGPPPRRADPRLLSALAARPSTIEDVLGTMREIDAILPSSDGVAHFNAMYLAVTEDVHLAARAHEFEDAAFIEVLDVVFADLYFRALEAHERRSPSSPRAWRPLFDARGNGRIAPLQFALAGMNAHINRDLVVAVVETCTRLGHEPAHDSAQYRDFVTVNRLLAQAQERIEPRFKRGVLGILDRVLGGADEAAQMWSIERAREAAWIQAEALWELSSQPSLADRFVLTLDRMVGFAGRGLLVPSPI